MPYVNPKGSVAKRGARSAKLAGRTLEPVYPFSEDGILTLHQFTNLSWALPAACVTEMRFAERRDWSRADYYVACDPPGIGRASCLGKRPRAWGEGLVCPIAVRLPCRSGHPASSSGLFYSILGFRLGCGLPLHVLWGIGTATLQRYDVIHHISRTVPGRRSC